MTPHLDAGIALAARVLGRVYWVAIVSLLFWACSGRCSSDAENCAGRFPLTSPPERVKLPGENDGRTGFADYHAHMFSSLSFGQYVFAGKAYPDDPSSPTATETALAPCEHTSASHLSTKIAVSTLEPGHSKPDGYPDFEEWPRYNTRVHQQMYIDWVYRSYEYGLRLLSVVVTNNETLCGLVYHPGPCNDMRVVDAQIAEIKRMAGFEHEWMQIAYSAAEADAIIRSNRLAVVIGIEVDTLLDCGISKERRCSCTDDEVKARLERYHALGVRQINPIHMADNGFGGDALYKEVLTNSHYLLRNYYADYYDCFDQGVRWTLQGAKAIPWQAQLVSFLTKWRIYHPQVSETKAEGHCNALGLTSDCGRTLIREMMRHGMLIDLEHMSQRSVDDTLAIAESAQYPVMLSHTWFRDLKLPRERVHFANLKNDAADSPWDQQRSEMHRSAETVLRVNALGGVVGILTNQGPLELPPTMTRFVIPNNCDGSSRSFAQAFIRATQLLGTDGGIGFGTDFNGLAGQPGPRFGPDACPGAIIDAQQRAAQVEAQAREGARVLYDDTSNLVNGMPLTHSQAGHRRFDINEDGLAHFGMLPDFIADLEVIGLPSKDTRVLFRSADAYVKMWERAEAAKARIPTDLRERSATPRADVLRECGFNRGAACAGGPSGSLRKFRAAAYSSLRDD